MVLHNYTLILKYVLIDTTIKSAISCYYKKICHTCNIFLNYYSTNIYANWFPIIIIWIRSI